MSPQYAEVLRREHKGYDLHYDHEGTLRWVEDEAVAKHIMALFDAKNMNQLYVNGAEKNDPLVRELYMALGYSLNGFWEVFYWRMNNDNPQDYRGRLTDAEWTLFLLQVEIQ